MGKIYGAFSITGNNSLQSYDGTTLNEGDAAIVFSSSNTFIYNLNSSSGAESDDLNIVSPLINPGNKRWLLVSKVNRVEVDNVNDIQNSTLTIGTVCYTKGYYTAGGGGEGSYFILTLDEYGGSAPVNGIDFPTNGGTAVAKFIGEELNILQAGVKNDGSEDALSKIPFIKAYAEKIIIPAGTYLSNGVTYIVDAMATFINKSGPANTNIFSVASQNAITLVAQTSTSTEHSVAESRKGISISCYSYGDQNASPIRGNLYNYSTHGSACFYSRAVSVSTAVWSAALHGETRHGGGASIAVNSETATYSIDGNPYGMVINYAGGAEPTHPISGDPLVQNPNAIGLHFVAHADEGLAWPIGIHFDTESMLYTGYSFFDESKAKTAIYLAGNYTDNDIAIKLAKGNRIALSGTGAGSFWYDDTSDLEIMFAGGGTTPRIKLNVSSTPSIKIADKPVIVEEDSGIFTPVLTAEIPGDLSVVYNDAVCQFNKQGKHFAFSLYMNFTPTFTTASGEIRIAGWPYKSAIALGSTFTQFFPISISSGGWTLPGVSTALFAQMNQDKLFMNIENVNNGVGNTTILLDSLTSGNAYRIGFNGTFISE